jgi:hypothetical protein
MGGSRANAGRHKRDCECDKCTKKHGSRPVDGNLARKIKAKIKAEQKWLLVIELATEKAKATGHTSDLRHALEYLDDRDLGRPMDTVNHLHKEPLEMNVNVSIAEVIRDVRLRKQDYERNRK